MASKEVLFSALEERLAAGRVILAIDGPCGAGKSTLARALEERFGGNVIHLDDFFLRLEQRAPSRLEEIGGNFDRERFLQEVLLPLQKGEAFSYRPWLCSVGAFGEAIPVPVKNLNVIEGSYSHHPALTFAYDLRVFLDLSREEQLRRLKTRDPEKFQRFQAEWIPKEDAYFSAFQIRDKAHLIL